MRSLPENFTSSPKLQCGPHAFACEPAPPRPAGRSEPTYERLGGSPAAPWCARERFANASGMCVRPAARSTRSICSAAEPATGCRMRNSIQPSGEARRSNRSRSGCAVHARSRAVRSLARLVEPPTLSGAQCHRIRTCIATLSVLCSNQLSETFSPHHAVRCRSRNVRDATSAYICMPSRLARRRPNIMWSIIMALAMLHSLLPYLYLPAAPPPPCQTPKQQAPDTCPGPPQHLSIPHRGGVLPQAHSCIRCLDAPRDRTQVLGIQILRVACPATNEIATYWQPFAWSVHRDGILSAKHDVPVLVRQQPTALLDATAYPAVPSSQADFSNFMTFLASGSPAHSLNTLSRVGTHAIDAPGGSNGNIRAYFM